MNFEFDGQTALVTGASQGIGRATARGLAKQGVHVAMAARRRGLLEALAKEIVADGGREPIVIEADLYPEDSAERLAEAAIKQLGRVDILVNAAGGSRPIPVESGKAHWMEAMTLNFFRLRELSHAVLPQMRKQKWGRIVNITGTSEPRMLNAAFSAKAGVHAWSKGLSREIGRHGVTINCIAPGKIMSEQILRKYTQEYRTEMSEKEIPVGRFGTPEELASMAVYLASPIASYVTGAMIPVDGGLRRYAY